MIAWLPTSGASKARICPHAHCSLNFLCHRQYLFEIKIEQARVRDDRVQTPECHRPPRAKGGKLRVVVAGEFDQPSHDTTTARREYEGEYPARLDGSTI